MAREYVSLQREKGAEGVPVRVQGRFRYAKKENSLHRLYASPNLKLIFGRGSPAKEVPEVSA